MCEWDKQIEEFRKKEEKYFSGSVFAFADYISLFGYQFLVDLKLDSDNEILKKLTASCEPVSYTHLDVYKRQGYAAGDGEADWGGVGRGRNKRI